MLLHVQKRVLFRECWKISPDTRMLTILLTIREGETCDSLGANIGANQTAILNMNPGISCKLRPYCFQAER